MRSYRIRYFLVEVTCSNDDKTMTIKIIPYNDVNGNTFEGKVTAVNRIENLNTADQHVLDPDTVVPDVGVPYTVDFETFEDRTGPENLKAVLLDVSEKVKLPADSRNLRYLTFVLIFTLKYTAISLVVVI